MFLQKSYLGLYNIKIFLHIRKAHMNYTTLEEKVCNF